MFATYFITPTVFVAMIQMYFFRVPKDKQNEVDLINNGQFGRLIAGEEGTISKTGEITSISFSLSLFFLTLHFIPRCVAYSPVLYQSDWWAGTIQDT